MAAMMTSKHGKRRLSILAIAFGVLASVGCGNFFVPPDNSGGGGTTTTGPNAVYVLNTATQTVSGFIVGTGKLTGTPSSPYSLGYTPLAAAVARSNSILYVAGPGSIYAYVINSDGSLSGSSSGSGVAVASVSSLDVSPDGKWLVGLDTLNSTLDVWQISSTVTGALGQQNAAPYSVTDAVVAVRTVKVSPKGDLIFASLGTGGDHVFTFNTSTGAVASSQHLPTGSATTSDNALAIDSTGSYLYIARSGTNGGVAVYSIGTGGQLTQVTGSVFAAGVQTYDVTLDNAGKYVYAANRSDGTISSYSIGSGGALTALSGSPYASGKLVSSLATERGGKYLLAAASGGSPDLTMYGFDTTVAGKLVSATTASTGTDPSASLVVATH